MYDVWSVNEDSEYHESGSAGEQKTLVGLRGVPRRIPVEESDAA